VSTILGKDHVSVHVCTTQDDPQLTGRQKLIRMLIMEISWADPKHLEIICQKK